MDMILWKGKLQLKSRAKQCHGRVCFRLSCSADNSQLAASSDALQTYSCVVRAVNMLHDLHVSNFTTSTNMLLAVWTQVTISNSIIMHQALGLLASCCSKHETVCSMLIISVSDYIFHLFHRSVLVFVWVSFKWTVHTTGFVTDIHAVIFNSCHYTITLFIN